MGMWQQLLERFVPLMDDDISSLDRRDGVGWTTGPPLNTSTSAFESTAPAGRTSTVNEGISPLPS